MESCLLITGEKSGEEHALSFFYELKKLKPETNFFGVGGDELAKAGLENLYHLNDFSSWGYSEVVTKIPFYIKAMNTIVEEVKSRNCKTAILVDFQSFNLKLAGKLKNIGVEVLYYVAPQAWAWKEYRVKKLAQSVHTLFTIIPFEKKWFNERGVSRVISIDHPLWTTYKKDLQNFHREASIKNPVNILLLPGSRRFEVESQLPIFIESIKHLKKIFSVKVSIVQSNSVAKELFDSYSEYFDKVYSNDQLVEALKNTDFSMASSGTVTLTCALYEVPTVVCYKTSLLNQFIYETVVSYRGFVSLANIIQNSSIFPEFLQDQVSSYNIVSQIKNWYYNKEDFQLVKMKLRRTKNLVQGEAIDIPKYMADVIESSYGKKNNTLL